MKKDLTNLLLILACCVRLDVILLKMSRWGSIHQFKRTMDVMMIVKIATSLALMGLVFVRTQYNATMVILNLLLTMLLIVLSGNILM